MWTRCDESTAFREGEKEKAVSEGVWRQNGSSSSTSCQRGEIARTAPQIPRHARRCPLSGAPENVERRFHLETMVEEKMLASK
jgi:hypothetical protein